MGMITLVAALCGSFELVGDDGMSPAARELPSPSVWAVDVPQLQCGPAG